LIFHSIRNRIFNPHMEIPLDDIIIGTRKQLKALYHTHASTWLGVRSMEFNSHLRGLIASDCFNKLEITPCTQENCNDLRERFTKISIVISGSDGSNFTSVRQILKFIEMSEIGRY